MNLIKRFLCMYLLALSVLWWWADTTQWAELPNFFAWRAEVMQFSGVLAVGVMSLAMVLALRPVLFESALGGLDKMYRLHKWLGISALVLSVSHWLLSEAPKWLVGLGWLVRLGRGPRHGQTGDGLVHWFQSQRGLAEGLGEWAFYAAVVLILVALIKRFPYKQFFKTHHFLAVVYLVLVWHSAVLFKFDQWGSALGLVMVMLMSAGSVAAVMVLLGKVASRRQVMGQVVATRCHPELNVLEVTIALHGRWAGHASGQFAFVTLHADEGAHPYTISSAWVGDGRISFIIKALGDYTSTLVERVNVGDMVKVEGPYGRFNFDSAQPRQIWVGAGIGITPFISRMQTLAKAPDGKTVDLFHTTAVYAQSAIHLLEQDAKAAGIGLHVWWDERDGLLTAAHIIAQVPQWQQADVWFCGPAAFGHMLKKDLVAQGLSADRFHQELFEMR